MKKPNLPIHRRRFAVDKSGQLCRFEVDIVQTSNLKKYGPDGIKTVFKVLREVEDGEYEEVVLIDNHNPLGFHNHDALPGNHNSRETICATHYQEAWEIFDQKLRELF